MARARSDTYSYSRLSTFDDCPRRYKFRYVDKLQEAFDSVEAFVGRTVHKVLAWLYDAREAGGAPSESQALERFHAAWEQDRSERVRLVRQGDSFEARREQGAGMVRSHYRGAFLQDTLETLSVEERFDLTLGGRHRYMGFMDRVARDADGRIHVIDYKTTARPPAVLTDEHALQLRSYGMASLDRNGGHPVRLSYHYLANGTVLGEDLDPPQARRTEAVLVEKIERTQQAKDFPPRPSALCAWCGFREVCDASDYFQGPRPDDWETSCPSCGGELRRRRGRYGSFLGCSNYPACRFTRNA